MKRMEGDETQSMKLLLKQSIFKDPRPERRWSREGVRN